MRRFSPHLSSFPKIILKTGHEILASDYQGMIFAYSAFKYLPVMPNFKINFHSVAICNCSFFVAQNTSKRPLLFQSIIYIFLIHLNAASDYF